MSRSLGLFLIFSKLGGLAKRTSDNYTAQDILDYISDADGNIQDESLYYSEAWSAWQQIRTSGLTLANSSSPSQSSLNEMRADLEEIWGLLVEFDTADLNAYFSMVDDEAPTEDETLYTPNSWTAYVNARTGANDALAAEPPTQRMLDEALEGLETAFEALLLRANKTALDTAIDNYDGMSLAEEDYTSGSWSTYTTARNTAVSINNNANATQLQVDNALAALTAAYEGLVPAA